MADWSDPRLRMLALQRFGLGLKPGQGVVQADVRERLLAEIRNDGAPQPRVSFSGAAPPDTG